jgi:hypothetical protein
MDILPAYVLIGVGVGFLVILTLQNLRLALEFLAMVGKVAVILLLLTLLGWVVGLWELPRPLSILILGLRRLWRPFQERILDWIYAHLR